MARNIGLDLARTCAITMVFTCHVLTFGSGASNQALTVLNYLGHAGVELFFSLSGFLIGRILLRMAQYPPSAARIGTFLIRRWLRTLPLYWAVLFTMGAWLGIDVLHAALLLQNFYPAEPRAIPVSWSLVMEEYFYFFFPLLMAAFALVGLRGPHGVGAVAALLIAGGTLLRLANAYGLLHVGLETVHESPLFRMDCAAYGALAAWALYAFGDQIERCLMGRQGWLIVACGSLAMAWGAVFTWIVMAAPSELTASGIATWGPPYFALQHAMLDATFAVAVVALALSPLRLPALLITAVTRISMLSYSIYLTHLGVIVLTARLASSRTWTEQALITCVVTLALSWATYQTVERPALALRRWLAPERA